MFCHRIMYSLSEQLDSVFEERERVRQSKRVNWLQLGEIITLFSQLPSTLVIPFNSIGNSYSFKYCLFLRGRENTGEKKKERGAEEAGGGRERKGRRN